VTVVSCLPFCDENVAALLSLLINKHGQQGHRHLNKCKMKKLQPRNIQVAILQWQWSPVETFLRNL